MRGGRWEVAAIAVLGGGLTGLAASVVVNLLLRLVHPGARFEPAVLAYVVLLPGTGGAVLGLVGGIVAALVRAPRAVGIGLGVVSGLTPALLEFAVLSTRLAHSK